MECTWQEGGIIMQTVTGYETIGKKSDDDLSRSIEIIRNSVYPIIGHLSKHGYYFSPDEKAGTIYEAMKLNPAITEFTVVEDNVAIGFMTRTALNETLGGRYGFEVNFRNPIRDIMKSDFLRVDCIMPADQVAELAMQRPFERLYNPIVVEQEGRYSGIVTVKDLLETCMKIAVAERDEITVMKDSLKIGLFFMDRNLIIQDHYSRYLEEILSEKNLFGKCFSDILSASVSAWELDTIRDYFEMVFERRFDQSMLDDINPLNEIHYVNVKTGKRKVFHCSFSTIERTHGEVLILVTIYDITAKIELQQRLLEEENRRQEEMKSVFELLQVEPQVFNDFLEDAEYEFERIDEVLKSKAISTREALVEIYQSVHAIKSNAVVLGLNVFGNKMHNLESGLKKLREQEEVTSDTMLNLAADIERLSCEKDGFRTTIEKINSFKAGSGGENRSQGQYVLIESLARIVNKTSVDMGKKVQFMAEGIDDEAIKNGPRRIIKEVLMQLIRNSVVHGIETPEDRAASGKNETGFIRLSIKLNGGNIHVRMGDDGRGLDYGKIAAKALRLNLIRKEDMKNRNVLLKAIFSPGFSTAETEGFHAGRGIGLSLVQNRIREAKGSIKVQTESGKGTIFNIFFPVN
jgi:two-component system chemotaxis sensor kinase CheA